MEGVAHTNRYRHQITDVDDPLIEGGVDGLVAALVADIDDTLRRLVEGTSNPLTPDPIVDDKFTRISRLVSSALKRHGLILERTVLLRLKQCPRFLVWNTKEFKVSGQAWSAKSDTENFEHGEAARRLQVDAFVYDRESKSLRAYEIKRASSYFDAGKRQSIKQEMKAIQVLLKSYGEQKGLDVRHWSSHVIFWYGKVSVKESYGLRGKEVDGHFGWPTFDAVEKVNDTFKDRLDSVLTTMILESK